IVGDQYIGEYWCCDFTHVLAIEHPPYIIPTVIMGNGHVDQRGRCSVVGHAPSPGCDVICDLQVAKGRRTMKVAYPTTIRSIALRNHESIEYACSIDIITAHNGKLFREVPFKDRLVFPPV